MTDKFQSYLGCNLIPDKYKDLPYFRHINNVYKFHYELLCGKIPFFLNCVFNDKFYRDKNEYLNDYMKLALGVRYKSESYQLNTYCKRFNNTKWCIVYGSKYDCDTDLTVCIDGFTSTIQDLKFKFDNLDINDLKFLFYMLRY